MAESYIGKILGGKYRVDSLIVESDLADLYRGTNTAVDREVTIKIVKPTLTSFRFEIFEEARKISRLSHPNILSVIDLGEDENTVFVVYDSFSGRSLRAATAEEGRFSTERAIAIVRQAAAALGAVYPVREIHGFLDLDNFLLAAVDGSDELKVLNFYHAGEFRRQYPGALLPAGIEETNFASPEQLNGKAADERSDVYPLGVLLFWSLTGELPFAASSFSETTKKIIDAPPPPLTSFRSDLPEGLERVMLTALSKNPEMRYQTIAEFSRELGRFSSADGETPVAAAATAGKNDIWKTAFAVLAAISLLTVPLIYATSVKQTNPTTQLQPDANGQPVQPLGPATGLTEQNLASMQDSSAETISNSNMAVPPGTLPGGDGYDPWKNGGKPPAGAPVSPGGQVVTIDPNNPSPFMTNDGPCIPQPSGILLCPAPINKAVKPTPSPKPSAANTNVEPKATPTPEVKASPAANKPAAKPTPVKNGTTGKPKNGDDEL